MLTAGFERRRSYIRQRCRGSCWHPYNTRLRDRQVEPWNETQESKRAEREDVPVFFPINLIKVHGCLSGEIRDAERCLKKLEFYQDNGLFKEHDRLVKEAIHHYKKREDSSMVWVLRIEESATNSYQNNWEQARKQLVSVIHSDLRVECWKVIKARALYLLVAHMRRKEEYRKSKTGLSCLLDCLKDSMHLLHCYNSPEDWAELYQTYGCVWMDYMSQLPLDQSNVERENAMDCFRRAIYFSKQDPRERVQMKRQSYVHLKLAMIHLGCCSTFPLAQGNHIPQNDIKEAKRHLDFIQSKFGDTIPRATRMLHSKTQSDLFYLQRKYQRAKDKAVDAYKCAKRYGFNTEVNILKEKKDYYQKKLETYYQILPGKLDFVIIRAGLFGNWVNSNPEIKVKLITDR